MKRLESQVGSKPLDEVRGLRILEGTRSLKSERSVRPTRATRSTRPTRAFREGRDAYKPESIGFSDFGALSSRFGAIDGVKLEGKDNIYYDKAGYDVKGFNYRDEGLW